MSLTEKFPHRKAVSSAQFTQILGTESPDRCPGRDPHPHPEFTLTRRVMYSLLVQHVTQHPRMPEKYLLNKRLFRRPPPFFKLISKRLSPFLDCGKLEKKMTP